MPSLRDLGGIGQDPNGRRMPAKINVCPQHVAVFGWAGFALAIYQTQNTSRASMSIPYTYHPEYIPSLFCSEFTPKAAMDSGAHLSGLRLVDINVNMRCYLLIGNVKLIRASDV